MSAGVLGFYRPIHSATSQLNDDVLVGDRPGNKRTLRIPLLSFQLLRLAELRGKTPLFLSERIQPRQERGCPQTHKSLNNCLEMRQFGFKTSGRHNSYDSGQVRRLSTRETS